MVPRGFARWLLAASHMTAGATGGNPSRKDEASRLARRALELRPDFWWVRTQVMPLTVP